MGFIGNMVIGAVGGFCAAAILFEVIVPGIAAAFASRRRSLQ